MAVFRVVVVARAIKIGRHDTSVIAPILAVIAFAHLYSGDLGDGIGFIGWFQLAREQRVFGHRLNCKLGINAARPQEKQLLYAMHMRCMDNVGLHHQVVINKFCGIGTVGMNAANASGSQINLVWPLPGKEFVNCSLIAQIEFGAGTCDHIEVSCSMEASNGRRADHAKMTGNINLRLRHSSARCEG